MDPTSTTRNPSVLYLRKEHPVDPTKKGHPIACLVYSVDRINGLLSWEYSVHHSKDPFDKKRARFVAMGRFKEHPIVFSFGATHLPLSVILTDLAQAVVSNDDRHFLLNPDRALQDPPTKLIKALKSFIEYHTKSTTLSKTASRYPTTIVTARYGGTYEGGSWLAFPCDHEEVPSEAFDDDCTCAAWWASDSSKLVGRGNTPTAAYDDLLARN